jgi:histidyl-tRNA synthetase
MDSSLPASGGSAPIYVTAASEGARGEAFRVAAQLRRAGLAAQTDYLNRSLKAQMREAGRLGCRWVVILGEEDLRAGQVTLRDMQTQQQTQLPRAELITKLTSQQAGDSPEKKP